MNSLTELFSWQRILVAVIIYFLTVAIYRLYFHPLSHIPGPKLAALTRWYEAYYDVYQNGQYTFKIKELHKEYGRDWLFFLTLVSFDSHGPNP